MVALERSTLSVPASNWHMIEKAIASRADVVFLDLEDAVAVNAKVESRQNVIRAIKGLDWGPKPPTYRVNSTDTAFFYRDLITVLEEVGDAVRVIIVPKVDRPETLIVVDTLLTQIETHVGLERGKIELQAQIESAEGIINVDRIATATARLRSLSFGPGDYAASMRMPVLSIGAMDHWDEQYPGHRFHYPMSRLAVAARAAGLDALDGPVANFRDLDAFRRSCIIARGLGYDGKWCIHPGQIEIANEIFSPTKEEIAWAQRVVAVYQAATAKRIGATSLDGTMLDAASIHMAEATLNLAERASLVTQE